MRVTDKVRAAPAAPRRPPRRLAAAATAAAPGAPAGLGSFLRPARRGGGWHGWHQRRANVKLPQVGLPASPNPPLSPRGTPGPAAPAPAAQVTGEDTCAEVNECLMSNIPFTREDCKCPRCVCTNTPGGFK